MFEKKPYIVYNELMCHFAIAVASGDTSFTAANYPTSQSVNYSRFIEGCGKLKEALDSMVELYYQHATDENALTYAKALKNTKHYFKNTLKVFACRQAGTGKTVTRPLFNLDEAAFYALGLELSGVSDKDVARHLTIMIGNVLQGRNPLEKSVKETKKEADTAQAKKARETTKARKKVLAEKEDKITQLEAENTALKAVSIDTKKLATLINKSHATDAEKAEILAVLGLKPSKTSKPNKKA